MIPTFAPTPPPVSSNQYAETINAFANMSIGIAALFVLALFAIGLIAYFYTNRNKDQGTQAMLTTFSQAMGKTLAERDERIDSLEASEVKREQMQNEGLMAVGDGLNRIADLWTAQQKREGERDRILSDAASAMTAIVTTGSKPLQQVVKGVGDLQTTSEEIQKVVSQIFDRYMVNFPTQRPIDELFDHLKLAILDAIEKKCGDQIRPVTDQPVTNVVNVNTTSPADTKPADAGSEAA